LVAGWVAGTAPEGLNREIKCRIGVVDNFPKEAAVFRLVGALLLEPSDEGAIQRDGYMALEGISAVSDTTPAKLCAVPARIVSPGVV
jgi:putative transposase